MVTFGGYDVEKFSKPGLKEKDVFWASSVNNEKYWTLNMNSVFLGKNKVNDIISKYVIMDTGVSYSLIPTDDFNALISLLKKNFGVNCTPPPKKEQNLVTTHQCTCKDYSSLPTLNISIAQDEHQKEPKNFSLPKESYMEKHDGTCRSLRLIPNKDSFGA